jgi:hypothetical protein
VNLENLLEEIEDIDFLNNLLKRIVNITVDKIVVNIAQIHIMIFVQYFYEYLNINRINAI